MTVLIGMVKTAAIIGPLLRLGVKSLKKATGILINKNYAVDRHLCVSLPASPAGIDESLYLYRLSATTQIPKRGQG